jgi:hypothetical protein
VPMSLRSNRQRTLAAGLGAAVLLATAASATVPSLHHPAAGLRPQVGNPGDESVSIVGALGEREQSRTAPTGSVAPGAYEAAAAAVAALPTTALGAKDLLSGTPYDADDAAYRDPAVSNSGGGAGFVTGRVQGLTVAGSAIYAGGAAGGVWRSTDGGSSWTAISDGPSPLPAQSIGVLKTNGAALWAATGDGTTGSGTYAGNGVWVATIPTAGAVAWRQVGGNVLDGTIIRSLVFDKTTKQAFAATSRGLYSHSSDPSDPAAWKPVLAPCAGVGTTAVDCSATNSNYRDIANDVAVDPKDGRHLLANVAWRSGAAYNGFYESTDGGSAWTRVDPTGSLSAGDVGNTTFGYTGDGGRLYAAVESPKALNGGDATTLGGVYVSRSGSVAGPWTLATNSKQLSTTGSAQKQSVIGKGYSPGVQAWYNQFLGVDPADPDHVYLGLEEVYESRDGGNTWKTVGRYWDFGFACQTTGSCDGNVLHSDQHAVAFGDPASSVTSGKVYVGNDGGLYSRSLAPGAASWTSLSRTGQLHTLQYYSVAVGKDAKGGTDVWGGLQDNGVSLLRGSAATEQVSPFGGDGGDQLTDPTNGCRTVGEYVYLTLSMTTNCGATDGSGPSPFTAIAPGDDNPRFTAPFGADRTDPNGYWVAGGHYVWGNSKTWSSTSGADWTKLGATPGSTTAIDSRGRTVWAGWCGDCNPGARFASGLVSTVGGALHAVAPSASTPRRMINAVVADPAEPKAAYVGFGGFSRSWTTGPGGTDSKLGHVFRVVDNGSTATWTDLSAGLPDVPVDSIRVGKDGSLLVGTDLGLLARSATGTWSRVSDVPMTVVTDFSDGVDGKLYVATFGRGLYVVGKPPTAA